ncbi:response regulator transcription factor [Paenibacillus flagellatus]|uniref:DNA-binding response regulator n=1 Tax=Paenibacillus flagellatus TaxID=2211139 RepID=A0A2V5KB16_9BACL|nr:response regulator transcription factor [Paenibacillus flagellatus]PYI51030.1 hypothetical protein DLM86_27070 [Paenibacillus flagellatus]
MYSLLIVDDEKWVRQGLRTTVDWASEGIEVIGEAADGAQALELMRERTPDIVLTDVKMPELDGLALMEEIRSRGWACQVVVISGYDDFHFARQAIKCGAVDYILKPIQETNLVDVIRRCADRLDTRSRQMSQMSSLHLSLRESVPLAKQRHLEMLLTGERTYGASLLAEKWQALRIPLTPERIRVVAAWVHDWGEKGRTDEDKRAIAYALGNMAEEIASRTGSAVACPVRGREAQLAVLYSGRHGSGAKAPFAELIDFAARYLGVGVTLGVSGERDAVSLPASFEEAVEASLTAFYEGFGAVYECRASVAPEPSPASLPAEPGGSWFNRVLHAMKLGDEPAIRACIEEWLDPLRDRKPDTPPHVMYRTVSRTLESLAAHWGQHTNLDEKADRPEDESPPVRMPVCTIEELRGRLPELLLRCAREAGPGGGRSRIVQLALAYIHQHYAEPLSMNDVAEAHHVNASYFSSLFHEEVGETFSKYVMRLRMEKAKRFLKESTMKVYEVAYKVGYNDYRHFAKTFKDAVGVTPAQFREWGSAT